MLFEWLIISALVIRTASSVIFISQVWVLRSAVWILCLSVRWTFRVRKLEKLTNITFSRGFARSLQDQTEYIAAIGAAIEPVGFSLKELKTSRDVRQA